MFAECIISDTRQTTALPSVSSETLGIFTICRVSTLGNHQIPSIFNICRVSTLGLYGTLGNNQHVTRACAVLTDGVPAVSTSPNVR